MIEKRDKTARQLTAPIRSAVARDLDVIVSIYNSTIAGRMVTADTEPVTVESRRQWFESHDDERHPIWVVDVDGSVQGWASFSVFKARPAYDATVEISLYIAPSHRRRGLGQLLLSHALTEAPRRGITALAGFVFAHNEPSLRLLERNGFERWGLLPDVCELDGVRRSVAIVGRHV